MASPSDESISARSTLISTPVSFTTWAMMGFLPAFREKVTISFT
jgi:hypothetical protein